MPTVHVGIRVPFSLYEKLKTHAAQVSISKSEIILSALALYLDSTENVPLSVRMAELEKKVGEIESLMKVVNAEEKA